MVRKSKDQGWNIGTYPYLGVRKEREEEALNMQESHIWIKSKKPRKGLQTDAVDHKGYEWIEVKFIEQKRLVDQKDYPFTNRGARNQMKSGKGEIDEEVDVAAIDCPWNVKKEREK